MTNQIGVTLYMYGLAALMIETATEKMQGLV